MVGISQIATINNYYVGNTLINSNTAVNLISKDNNLLDLLNKLDNQNSINNKDLDSLINLFKTKTEQIETNSEEITNFIIKLKDITRQGYATRSEIIYYLNDETKKLFQNTDEDLLIFKTNYFEILLTLNIDHVTKNKLLQLYNKHQNLYAKPNKAIFVKLEKQLKEILQKKIELAINKTAINYNLKKEYLSKNEQELFEKEKIASKLYPLSLGGDNWNVFLKTLSFSTNEPSAKKTANKNFLYFYSTIEYKFNKINEYPAFFISNKQGDCTEATSLFYVSLAHSNAKNIKIFYMKENTPTPTHSFITFQEQGISYYADNGGVYKYDNLNSFLKKLFPEITEISEIYPQYHIDNTIAPEKYFDSLRWLNLN